jgi:hypothetical protein
MRNVLILLIASAACVALSSCSRTQTAKEQDKTKVEKPVQETYASPEEAGAALVKAAESGDHAAVLAIFGPDSGSVIFSGDAVTDQDNLKNFVARYNKMHRWNAITAGGDVLVTGTDNSVFPIPLGQNPSGRWFFDTAAGKDEILARRIGKGELTAIAALQAIVDAEQTYFRTNHEYTEQFVSDPGKQNGLYWSVPGGQSRSPLGALGDLAKALGYTDAGGKPQPFTGYYYRILTKQEGPGGAKDYMINGKMTGGFAVLAYPEQYGNSGIMTFIVGKDGIVYQKDLNGNTADAASAITAFNPSDGWTPVVQPPVKG